LTTAEPSFNFKKTEVDSGMVTSFAPSMQVAYIITLIKYYSLN
jgi:hypothetical protein